MKTKRCGKCGKIKLISEFNKHKVNKDGLNYWCKNCANRATRKWKKANKERVKELYKKWEINNHDRRIELNKRWVKNNPDKIKIYKRLDYIKNTDKYKVRAIKWKEENLERYRELARNWHKNKRNQSIEYRLNINIRRAIHHSLKENKNGRYWERLVGYTLQDLKLHLEKQFKKGMSWNSYGKNGWSIDHIKPISSFNFNSYDDKEFKKCWALNNLQPLWHKENLKKGIQEREVRIIK